MPVTFDFNNNSGGAVANSGGGQFDVVNIADGVRFTVVSDNIADSKGIAFGNGGPFPRVLNLTDLGGANNTFILNFTSVANPSNINIQGTTNSEIVLELGLVQGDWQIELRQTNGQPAETFTVTQAQDFATFRGTGVNVAGIRFISTGAPIAPFFSQDQIELRTITAKDFNCLCAGTRIDTPDGTVLVEDLKPGDQVIRADGGVANVRWVGRQHVDTRLTDPHFANPIRIQAGALGPGLPRQDMLISGDHAIGLDGCLINAGALQNGESILQEQVMPVSGFSYYHVETDAHELILAEGVPVETFLHHAVAWAFDNSFERPNQPAMAEMTLPRISTARHLPPQLRTRIQRSLVKVA